MQGPIQLSGFQIIYIVKALDATPKLGQGPERHSAKQDIYQFVASIDQRGTYGTGETIAANERTGSMANRIF